VIAGVSVEMGREAVVVKSDRPLHVLSSAVHGGGLAEARAVVNLHVGKDDPCRDPSGMIDAFARRAGVPGPWVGLLTGAPTERAALSEGVAADLRAMAVVTVGLSIATWTASTINTIVVVDADPEPAALVNLVMTATEVKGLALRAAGLVLEDGVAASGTSTDAVVVAATGRGVPARFGGPASPLGWVVARAVGASLTAAIRDWQERNR